MSEVRYERLTAVFPEEPPIGSVVLVPGGIAFQRHPQGSDGYVNNWHGPSRAMSWPTLLSTHDYVTVVYRGSGRLG